ncbi:MAG: maleylpyruvate isomerase N-terminal domain-containing protein [Anaerolineae bacterium]
MNIQELLFYADKRLQEALRDLPPESLDTPGVCGVWSVKDILSHLTACEHQTEEVLLAFTGGGEMPTLTRVKRMGQHKWNTYEVESRKALPIASILNEYLSAYEHTLKQIEQIPDEVFSQRGTIPWYGEQYALDDYLAYSQYGHKCEHGAQINVFKDALKAAQGT